MKKFGRFIHVYSILFLLLAIVEITWLHALLPLDARLSDFFVRIHAENLKPDSDIVIVNIDDDSLYRMKQIAGKWAWPRSTHAEMIEGISKQNPKAIVFDINFTEKDEYRPNDDALLNDSLKGKKNIFFALVEKAHIQDDDGPLLSTMAPKLGLTKTNNARMDARATFLLPEAIREEFWRVGGVNFIKDDDGIGRRYHVYTDAYGWLVPSLPARVVSDLGYPVPKIDDITLSWRGGKNPFQRISYADLYADFSKQHPSRDPHELSNKIVIIGVDASALHDQRATPIDSFYSGHNILATAIDNLKNQRYMQLPPNWTYLISCIFLLFGVYICFLKKINALYPAIILVSISGLSLFASFLALNSLWLIHTLTPLLLAWVYYFSLVLREYLIERRSRQKTVEQFSRFVNPYVVKELVANEGWTQSGEAREITVLFSDIRGFTSLSESRSPQEVVSLLNRYFTLQVEVVFKHGGSLDKFIGDCIMAFWGAPTDNPNHAFDAVSAAIEMAEVLQTFKRELGDLEADFDVGIGLHSGPAVVGFIGSERRKEYTAIGDTVNLASRIEGLTKGISRILVSRETMLLCDGKLDFQAVGSYKVKGREQEVELFSPTMRDKT